MRFKEIDYTVKIQPMLEKQMILIDDARFSIVLYNLISNSVKHTYGGIIKVSVKVLDQDQMDVKMRKCKSTRKARAKVRSKNLRAV